MKALTWQGKRDVRVEEVPDPRIEEPTDAIIKITSTAICGSDLHLYEVLGPYLTPGDVLGHEPMGIVEEVGPEVTHIKPGDRVVIPFNISCGHCWMCQRGFYAQCETTQVREQGKGATPVRLHQPVRRRPRRPGRVPARARRPSSGRSRCPREHSDQRFLYLSDILPTAWQGVKYADVPQGGTLAVIGLGPVGQFAARIGRHLGAERVIGVDLVPERLALAAAHGIETLDLREVDDVAATLIEMTGGRGSGRRRRGGRHGGARVAGGEDRAGRGRPAPGRAGQAAHRQDGDRPARRAAHRPQGRPARRAPCRSAASTAARSTRCR